MSLKQYRAFYSVQCRRTYSDTWNMSCIFMSVIFSAPEPNKTVHKWANLSAAIFVLKTSLVTNHNVIA